MKLRITLVITTLESGGAEKVLARLANHLARGGHHVTILLIVSDKIFYDIDDRIEIRFLPNLLVNLPGPDAGVFERIGNILYRVYFRAFLYRRFRKALLGTNPDLVISFMDSINVKVLASALFTPIPVIVSERTNPYLNKVPRALEKRKHWLYPRAAAVVLQTRGLVPWTEGWLKRERVHVIPNPVPPPDIADGERPEFTTGAARRIVAMGRLGPEKGYDLLLGAFAKVAGRHPEWSLLILGEGTLRKTLENQVESLHLSGRVRMPGVTKRPAAILKSSDLFALTSSYEGFPNALCEAMACGLPAVSFDCRFGPSEIIRDGVDGVLVPPGDTGALAEALDRLMGDDAERERMAAAAGDVVDRFNHERIMGEWEKLIVSVAGKARSRPRRILDQRTAGL